MRAGEVRILVTYERRHYWVRAQPSENVLADVPAWRPMFEGAPGVARTLAPDFVSVCVLPA